MRVGWAPTHNRRLRVSGRSERLRREVSVIRVRNAAVGAVLVVLAGCGSGPSPSPAARSGAAPTQQESASPAPQQTISTTVSTPPSEQPIAGPELAPLSMAVVSATELNVRVAPSTSAALFDALLVKTPLPKGSRVLILDGPVDADGHPWYMVGIDSEVGAPVAWVAAAAPSGTPWLRPDEAACPEGDLRRISALTSIQRLGCFGSRSLSFIARQTTAPEDTGFGGTCAPDQPRWLVCEGYDWVNADGEPDASLVLYFDPAVGIEPTGLAEPGSVGELWSIQGHFGDAASPGCASGLAPDTIEYRSAWLGCATLFVVEKIAPAP
jgi:hypothetical protein